VVYFIDENGEIYPWEIALNQWETYEMGQEVVLEFDSFGKLKDVASP
jgi:hypothetical protein